MTTKTKKDLCFILLLLSVSAVISHKYYSHVKYRCHKIRQPFHNSIINGTVGTPYRYRVLVPFTTQACVNVLSKYTTQKTSFLCAYSAYDFLSISLIFIALYYWLKNWFTPEQAMIGVLFIAGTMPMALQDHYFQPWSLLEVALFTVALSAIYKKRYGLLFFIMILATLNRETAIFIPCAYFVTMDFKKIFRPKGEKRDWTPIFHFCGLLLIWAVLYFGLRELRGATEHSRSLTDFLKINLSQNMIWCTVINASLFLGGFWIIMAFGAKNAPPFVKRLIFMMALYIATIMLWGIWKEVRLLMPMYPIFLVLGLSFIYPPNQNNCEQ